MVNPAPGPVTPPSPPFQTIPFQDETTHLYVVKQREINTEIDQQRFHDETLQWYGEECVIRLLWRAEDEAVGLVTYCQFCQDSPNPANPNTLIQARVSNVYRQTGNSYCPECYGTSFLGGFQDIAYHLYMLASDTPETRKSISTGQFWQEHPRVQFSWFPQLRIGDLVVRIQSWDGPTPTLATTRFQVGQVDPQTIRTGPDNSMPPPYRTGAQPFSQTTKIVGQTCTLENLPPGHPYYNVPFV